MTTTTNNQEHYGTATYTNKALGETYTLRGVRDLTHAWNMADFVAGRNGWNPAMFTTDVKVKFTA
jgi:hypothetical protein